MDYIKVDIGASPNVGKSTIAALLTKTFKEAGIEYDLRNEDETEERQILREQDLSNRLKALADKKIKVIITQTPLHRNWQDM
jgi:adenylate kinase family enzyme